MQVFKLSSTAPEAVMLSPLSGAAAAAAFHCLSAACADPTATPAISVSEATMTMGRMSRMVSITSPYGTGLMVALRREARRDEAIVSSSTRLSPHRHVIGAWSEEGLA